MYVGDYARGKVYKLWEILCVGGCVNTSRNTYVGGYACRFAGEFTCGRLCKREDM